ncbi:MAG: HEAT repeat domain-containing protein, partial [Sandaracinaceae bacterium]
ATRERPSRRRRRRPPPAPAALALLAVLAACLGVAPAMARAQAAEGSNAPAPTVRDIPELAARLDSSDPDEVVAAIDLLTAVDNPRVIPHLERLLRSGRSDVITDRALLALRQLAHPSALEILTVYTSHRRVGARRRAYQAIAAIEDRRVPALLERGLRDSDRGIRATSARRLGAVGNDASVETLFQAFDHRVMEASVAIGKLGDADAVERFHGYLGQAPLSVMLAGYREFLGRREIPQSAKMGIVQRIAEQPSVQVQRFLQRYLDTFPTTFRAQRDPLRREVVSTLRRLLSEAGGDGSDRSNPGEAGEDASGDQP